MRNQALKQSPWSWVPSLYFAQGLPYVLVITVSTVIYKNLGLTNAQITLYTGWFYLPWVIKPFWSPFIDHLKTKRYWVIVTQLIMGALIAAVGLSIPTTGVIKWSIILFWLIAFNSATHDIAADGFYMLGLSAHQQSFFVGIRNTAWRIAAIAGQGGLVYLSGVLSTHFNSIQTVWMIVLIATGLIYVLIALYHRFIFPHPPGDEEKALPDFNKMMLAYFQTIGSFIKKKNLAIFIGFLFLYRLGEAQLTKLAIPFLIDSKEAGGLALSNEQVGWAYGTIGVLGLVFGGILGGMAVAKNGLKFWIWPMALALNLPDILYWFMAHFHTSNMALIQLFIAFEQFGYGFGFTGFMLYLIYYVNGQNETSHYALATGIMALGMMLPGMLSGWIQEYLHYEHFFIWVIACTLPGLILIPFLKIDKDFGKKRN
ncbi:MAG: MFS transporter [Prolixibacteraceae bacterium]